MEMIGKHRVEADIDRETADQQLQPVDEPLAAMRMTLPGQRIVSQQVGSANTSLPTVINTSGSWPDDLPARTTSHLISPPSGNRAAAALGGATHASIDD
jgi:hypothetical protein